MEASEKEGFVKNITTQTPPKTTAGTQFNANRAPIDVATPLPPLNPSQTGKLCPRTANIAPRTRLRSTKNALEWAEPANASANFTATKPLATSTTNTG